MRIVFLGSGAFGLPTLEMLAREHELLAVVSQPDRPAGRHRKLAPTPISEWILRHRPDVSLFRPESINEPATVERVRSLDADAWLVIAYGQKLGKELMAGASDHVFAINLHASLLPRWRGAAPINAAVLAGDKETGNSVISIAERMDAGLVYGQSRRVVEPDLTAGELHDLLAADGPALIGKVLEEFARGKPNGLQQDESQVTYARKLSRADAWLDFHESAEQVRRRVHGLTPWPGVSVLLGECELRLLRVKVEGGFEEQAHSSRAGMILDGAAGVIGCGEGTLVRVCEVQPAGKRPMTWQEFTNGRAVREGDTLLPTRAKP